MPGAASSSIPESGSVARPGKLGRRLRRATGGLTAGAVALVVILSWNPSDPASRQPAIPAPTALSVTSAPVTPSAAAVRWTLPGTSAPLPPPSAAAGPVGPAPYGVATRLVIAALGVDLPVVSGDIDVAGNAAAYPLCDVAQYLSHYVQPGEAGTVYLYGHAQRGMLLPLLKASRVDDGTALLGLAVTVYTSAGWRHVYRIFVVRRHATDFRLADEHAAGEERLVIQTSEGPTGTVPKLQIAARLMSRQEVPFGQAAPDAQPRVCAPAH